VVIKKNSQVNKPRVLLLGYLGANNLGDECMLYQLMTYLHRYDADISLASYGLGYEELELSVIYPHIIFKKRHRVKKRLLIGRILRNVDIVLWVGGNCFTDHDGDGGFDWLLIAKLLGKKFLYLGIGLDKLTKNERKIKMRIALNLCDRVIFRDQYSLRQGHDIIFAYKKISYGKDLGELYIKEMPPEVMGKRKGILLSWRELQNHMADQHFFLNRLSDELIKFSKTYDEPVIIFETDDRVDLNVHEIIIAFFDKKGFNNYQHYTNLGLRNKLELIANSRCVITARLHTAVAAYLYGLPVAVFDYSQKITELYNQYPQILKLDNSMKAFEKLFNEQSMPLIHNEEYSLDTTYTDILADYLSGSLKTVTS